MVSVLETATKTVAANSFIFMQLYIIRMPLGSSSVALLPNKQQRSYEVVIKAMVDRSEELGFVPYPTVVITVFEKSAINAVQTVLGHHVRTQGCIYHLTQSTWRKVQDKSCVTLRNKLTNFRSYYIQ